MPVALERRKAALEAERGRTKDEDKKRELTRMIDEIDERLGKDKDEPEEEEEERSEEARSEKRAKDGRFEK